MDRVILRRRRVFDPVLRSIHAWNGLMIVLLAVSGQVADQLDLAWPVASLWRLHLWIGYGLVLGLTARVVWGVAGPRHARWRAFWHPQAWGRALRERQGFVAPDGFGHHALASVVYLAVYLGVLVMAITGLFLAAIDQGTGPLRDLLGYAVELKPWFRLPHEWLQYPFIAFIVAHLAALVLHERLHGVPMAQAMVSGYQYLKEKK